MKRRDFLKNLGITGAVLAAPAIATAATSLTAAKKETTPLTLKGRVHAGGKGIAGVAVTDGITVTVTDKGGSYALMSNSAAQFVYISIPAGYSIPHQKGIAHFYAPVKAKSGVSVADFSLQKLTVDDRKHHFVVWADTQMISEADALLLKTQSAPDLKDLVASYPAGSLFHGIGCGDLVWDRFELFEDYKQAVEMTGVTFFNVIGNHDMDLDARTDDHSSKTFRQQFGPTYYSFNRGAIHYVVLDDVFSIGAGSSYIGYITENQLQWLEQDLALVKPGSTVVVSLHIPTYTGAAQRAKKQPELSSIVSNREQLYKILAPYKVHIMSGHTHFNENWERENIMEHNHGTVCGAWWTGPICGDGTPNGYGVYEVDGEELKWYYKSTGFKKETQLRIYPKGSANEHADEIIANVWNWDKAWKVEWYEDGAAKGAMEQRVGLDPMAVQLYAGPQLPQKHTFAEPVLTEHLFYAKPSAPARQIKVKATDRFGQVYEETLNLLPA